MGLLKQQNTELKEWHDLWFDNKRAGYVAVTDFKRQLFYGANDIKKIITRTKGKEKQFISINAFDVNWNDRIYSRTTERLKQIRNIAIDIDQYNLDLTIDDVLNEIQALVLSNRIPEPNLILTSRGVQIFYSIEGGASPEMSWLASFITDQLITKLKHVGADSGAKDMSRVMRVPNSVNERNGANVTPSIWKDTSYNLQELQSYCRPLDKFETKQRKQFNVLQMPPSGKLVQVYKTNHARLRDFDRLIEARQGNFTGMRNTFLYMYSYHQALVLNTQIEVVTSVEQVFSEIYSTTAKTMSQGEFNRTVRSAYKDAREFFEHIQGNGYNVTYKANDGIKKPYKTDNIIKLLDMTEDEQRLMGSIRNSDIEREQRASYMQFKRLVDGTHQTDRQTYNEQRKQQQQARIDELKQLMKDNPNATQKELAKQLDVSVRTVKRYIKAFS